MCMQSDRSAARFPRLPEGSVGIARKTFSMQSDLPGLESLQAVEAPLSIWEDGRTMPRFLNPK